MNWLGSAGVPFCWSPLTFLKWLQLFGSWRVRDGLLPCLGPWCCLSGGLLTPLGPSSLGSLGKTHRASWNIPRTRTGSCKVSSCPSFMSTVFYQPNLTKLRSKWWGNWATPPDGRSYKVTLRRAWLLLLSIALVLCYNSQAYFISLNMLTKITLKLMIDNIII